MKELPDYLPALLEYLAALSAAEVHELLEDCVHILRAVGERLAAGGSPCGRFRRAARSAPRGAARAAEGRGQSAGRAALDEENGRRRRSSSAHRRGLDAAAAHGAQQSRAAIHPLRSQEPLNLEPRMDLKTYLNQFLFGYYPYICLTVFFLGSLIRFDREQYTWKSDSSQLLRHGQLDGIESVSHRHPRHLLRPPRRPADAACRVGDAGRAGERSN